jgi:hypothetical protein
LLNELGYHNVRDYRAGLSDWVDAGEPTESVSAPEANDEPSPAELDPKATISMGPPLSTSVDGVLGSGPARLSRMSRFDNSILDLVHRRSTLTLFVAWLGMILLCGLGYWLSALKGHSDLLQEGHPLGADRSGLWSAIYFSFVTATSIGYGDIVPIGGARILAVAEATTALLMFGAIVAKFVSRRQDELMSEIHRTTFEDRLDRVETNLHMVISELLAITAMCENKAPLNRISTRLESATIIFFNELRSTRDLLYQPRLTVEEGVLSGILATLASAINVLADLLATLPPDYQRSQAFDITLARVSAIAQEICGECVPHTYTPRLVFWMDRIQATAARIK